MVRNNIQIKTLFLLSFIYTISIVALTFSITYYFDQVKIREILYDYRYELLELNEYDITLLYVELYQNSTMDYCDYAVSLFDVLNKRIHNIGTKLATYGESSTKLSEKDYDYLKRKYYLVLLKEYYMFWNLKEQCQNINVGIFFFKKDHEPSLIMGGVYTELSEKLNNTYILPFDIDYRDVSLLEVIKMRFNITSEDAPVLIFNDKCIIKGMHTIEDVMNLVIEECYEG